MQIKYPCEHGVDYYVHLFGWDSERIVELEQLMQNCLPHGQMYNRQHTYLAIGGLVHSDRIVCVDDRMRVIYRCYPPDDAIAQLACFFRYYRNTMAWLNLMSQPEKRATVAVMSVSLHHSTSTIMRSASKTAHLTGLHLNKEI